MLVPLRQTTGIIIIINHARVKRRLSKDPNVPTIGISLYILQRLADFSQCVIIYLNIIPHQLILRRERSILP